MLKFSTKHNLYYWAGSFESRQLPKEAGFTWHKKGKVWITRSPYIAYLLHSHADNEATMKLTHIDDNVLSSMSKGYGISVPAKNGHSYLPFQCSGIDHIHKQFILGRNSVLLADEQGLGKTVQAIGVANIMDFKKLLVICPATLRLNWAREIEKWHLHNDRIKPILTGKDIPQSGDTVITSYNLAGEIKDMVRPDLVIVDESHYLKNYTSQRTKLILGDYRVKWQGIIGRAPTLFLTGTPEPNGKPTELYTLIKRCAPHIIDNMGYWQFVKRFCNWFDDGHDIQIKGAKNHEELYTRLRGSGFMIRRLKEEVLKDLPPKRHQMIVFPASGAARKVLKKEKAFNSNEIMKHGVPIGSALPEIRKEMGLAKLPECVGYISDLLEGGVDKLVVFAYHVEVNQLLEKKLKKYRPVRITGSTPMKKRQQYVDAFQEQPEVRVMIGNLQAAGTGITLTAAHDVVFVESSWVPGENDQCADRVHRIGQNERVVLHHLVVEGSIDSHILGTAANKQSDITRTLDD